MGYTHYWYRSSLDAKQFAAASAACKKVCEASGVKIASEFDSPEKPPIFTSNLIRFNGVGEDGYETFQVSASIGPETNQLCRHLKGFSFAFCKTAHKPYDLCVAACLVVLKHYFGQNFEVKSDGGQEGFVEAMRLCQKTIGYGADFRIDVEKEEEG